MDITDVDQYGSAFCRAYVTAMLWANTTAEDGEPLEHGSGEFNPNHLLPLVTAEAAVIMLGDCYAFLVSNWDDLEALQPSQAGHDFALTRNHHGAGFWDRGLGGLGDRLTTAAQTYGEQNLYHDGTEIGVI